MKEKIIKFVRWIMAAFIALMAVVGFPATIFFLLAAIVVAPIGVFDKLVIEKLGKWSKLKYVIAVVLFFVGIFSAPSTSSNDKFDPESLGDNYTIDYESSEAIETALNAGEDVNGKIVKFEVKEYHPDSSLGYNCFAGEHLNFISEGNIYAEPGDSIVAYIESKAGNILGSWKINYILLSHEKGKGLDEKIALEEKEEKSPENKKTEVTNDINADKEKKNDKEENIASTKKVDADVDKKAEVAQTKKEIEPKKTEEKQEEAKTDAGVKEEKQQPSLPNTQKQSDADTQEAALAALIAAQSIQSTSNSATKNEGFVNPGNDIVPSSATTYVCNTNTKKFHYPHCNSVKKIKPENYLQVTASREELLAQYEPCGNCNP